MCRLNIWCCRSLVLYTVKIVARFYKYSTKNVVSCASVFVSNFREIIMFLPKNGKTGHNVTKYQVTNIKRVRFFCDTAMFQVVSDKFQWSTAKQNAPSVSASAASAVAWFRSANMAQYRANSVASALVRVCFSDSISCSELGGAGSTDAYGLLGNLSLSVCDPWSHWILPTASWHVSATYESKAGLYVMYHCVL